MTDETLGIERFTALTCEEKETLLRITGLYHVADNLGVLPFLSIERLRSCLNKHISYTCICSLCTQGRSIIKVINDPKYLGEP